MKSRIGKRSVATALAALGVAALIAVFFWDFSARLNGELRRQTQQYLKELSQQAAVTLVQRVDGDVRALQAMASSVADWSGPVSGQARSMLSITMASNGFTAFYLIGQNGEGISGGGQPRQFDRASLEPVFEGRAMVGRLGLGGESEEQHFALAVPILKDGDVVGALYASYPLTDLAPLLRVSAFEGEIRVLLCNTGGVLLSREDEPSAQALTLPENTESARGMYADMESGRPGVRRVHVGGQDIELAYAPVDIEDWYVMALVPLSLIRMQGAEIQEYAALLYTKVGVVVYALAAAILLAFHRRLRQLSRSREAEQKSGERYQSLLALTDSIVFEYSVTGRRLIYCQNDLKLLGRALQFSENGSRQDVHAEDWPMLEDLAQHMRRDGMAQCECRLKKEDGAYIWCQIRVAALGDTSQNRRILGVITDINEQKYHTATLREQAQRDCMTKLLNKTATQSAIEQTLEKEPEAVHALLLIDIDDFKTVNDSLGHMFGDTVLSQFAGRLQTVFRAGDVLGRIGGDEFMVLLRNVESREAVSEQAEAVCELLNQIFTGQGELQISGSVGIALYDQDGQDFHTLYQHADEALYSAKKAGKNTYSFYGAETLEDQERQITAHNQFRQELAIREKRKNEFHEDVITKAFELLYEAQDMDAMIQQILAMAGRQYNVSRVYLFEDYDEGRCCRNLYEWCNQGIEPQIQGLQRVCYEEMTGLEDRFNREGVFYCTDINALSPEAQAVLKPQRILSMLHIAVRDQGKTVGFVGFDDCQENRLWTKEEIETLSLLSRLVGTFLRKRQSSDQLMDYYHNIHSMLDGSDNYMYVIDSQTFDLLYINKKTLDTVPQVQVGQKCYQAFWRGKTGPCTFCPLKNEQEGSFSTEVYNETLGIWTLVTAVPVKWTGCPHATMLTCTDITRYFAP